MTDDPVLTLLVEALNLMHPRFAAADMRAEFYHQFRRLWDKALPVKLGLGHVILQADPDAPPGQQPDFLFWQIGEHGQPDRRLAAVSIGADPAIAMETLERYHRDLEYPRAVWIAVGRSVKCALPGVAVIEYDEVRREARVQEEET